MPVKLTGSHKNMVSFRGSNHIVKFAVRLAALAMANGGWLLTWSPSFCRGWVVLTTTHCVTRCVIDYIGSFLSRLPVVRARILRWGVVWSNAVVNRHKTWV